MYALEHLYQYGGQVQQNGRLSYPLLQKRLGPDEEGNDHLKYAPYRHPTGHRRERQKNARRDWERDNKKTVPLCPQGWLRTVEKVDRDALARLRLCEGHHTVVVIKGQGNQPLLLAYLPEGNRAVGDPPRGFQAVVEALPLVDKNGERRSEAELHRPNAELLLDHERGTKGPGRRKPFRRGLSLL